MPTAIHLPEAPAESVAKVEAFDQACVCVLDDDLSMLKALDRLFKSDGVTIKTFSEPSAFLSAVANGSCHVAILDVWMPEMNGLEVHAVLRKTAPETRVIFISGRTDPSMRQTALDAGAFGFLSKPFDDEFLLQLVRRAIAS